TWSVRISLFVAALATSSLQTAFWLGDEGQITSLMPTDVEPPLNSGIIFSFRVLTFLLLGVVALGLVRAAIMLSQHLLKQIPAQAPTHDSESDVPANRLAYARRDAVGNATY